MPLVTPIPELSPICPDSFEPANFNGDVCSLLQQLLLTNEKLYGLLKWMFDKENSGCQLSPAFASGLLGLSQPIGSGFWAPCDLGLDTQEWLKADGEKYPYKNNDGTPTIYTAVYNAFGPSRFKPDEGNFFFMPKLSGRFMLCEGVRDKDDPDDEDEDAPPSYAETNKGGHDFVELKEAEIGAHRHGVLAYHGMQPDDWREDNGSALDRAAQTYTAPITVKKFTGAWNDVGEILGSQNLDDYSRVSTTTTENVITTPFNDPKTDYGDPHENMPPYFVGVYYIRINYKINGTIMKMQTTPAAPVTP